VFISLLQVHVTGLRQKIDIDFYLKEAPAPPSLSRAPITKSNVRHFYLGSTGFEGVIRDLSNDLIGRLNVGVVSFEIVESAQEKSILKTKWNKVSEWKKKLEEEEHLFCTKYIRKIFYSQLSTFSHLKNEKFPKSRA
jgi:hypothetical protein